MTSSIPRQNHHHHRLTLLLPLVLERMYLFGRRSVKGRRLSVCLAPLVERKTYSLTTQVKMRRYGADHQHVEVLGHFSCLYHNHHQRESRLLRGGHHSNEHKTNTQWFVRASPLPKLELCRTQGAMRPRTGDVVNGTRARCAPLDCKRTSQNKRVLACYLAPTVLDLVVGDGLASQLTFEVDMWCASPMAPELDVRITIFLIHPRTVINLLSEVAMKVTDDH